MTDDFLLRLSKDIDALRQELRRRVRSRRDLSRPEVVALSHQIDRLVVLYLKLAARAPRAQLSPPD